MHSVLPAAPTFSHQARNILVTNWPMSGVLQLMESFSLFTPSGSTVTFVLPEEPPPTWPTRIGACRFNYQAAADNPTSVKVGGLVIMLDWLH